MAFGGVEEQALPKKMTEERNWGGNKERVPVKSVTQPLSLMVHPPLIIHRTLYHIVLGKVCCDLEPRGGNIIYIDNAKLAPVAYLRLCVNFPTSKGPFPYSHIKNATSIYPDFLSVLSFRCHGDIVFWVVHVVTLETEKHALGNSHMAHLFIGLFTME